ncbi:MAG: hypothetical protein ABI689_04615 [Thermoanaerobaculia bacterium]
MKSRQTLVAFAALAAGLLTAAIVVAQATAPGSGPGGCQGRHGGGALAYDRAAETTLTGKVAELLPQACACGGLHLRLTTSDGALEVALGPAVYLAEIGAAFQPGDELQVTGVKPASAAPAEFMVRSVRKGEATFELRDADGLPRWAGAGKGCPMHPRGAAGSAG